MHQTATATESDDALPRLATTREACVRLGVAVRELDRMAATRVLPPRAILATTGAALYDAADVDALAAREEIDPATLAPVLAVRLGEPGIREGDGGPVGWDARWDAATKRDAAARWWRVREPQELVGGVLLALVGRVVVGAWRVAGWEPGDSEGGRIIGFNLKEEPALKKIAAKSSLNLGPGPLTKSWR